MSASPEPQFRSLGLPEKHVTRAWMAASIQAGLTLIMGVLAAAGVFVAPGFDAWILVDAAILAALAYGVWKRSRICVLLLLMYAIGNEVYLALQETSHFSILRLIFIYFYFRGTIQLFREHRSHASEPIKT
jgi:hypothetical protein